MTVPLCTVTLHKVFAMCVPGSGWGRSKAEMYPLALHQPTLTSPYSWGGGGLFLTPLALLLPKCLALFAFISCTSVPFLWPRKTV